MTETKNRYHGKVCRVCGETERYIKSRRCVECKGRIDHANYIARKEAKQATAPVYVGE